MMFTSTEQIKVVDRIDHLAKTLTPEQIEALYQAENGELLLESVTLEDLENTLLFQCEPVAQMMLEAFKSKASMLAQRVKKFGNQLERQTPNLTCGEIEIGKPRKSGAVAVQVAKIPLSDGQSVSIAFHAPDNDPLKINADDTLIAFRFMMNSRDVTHVVAPKGNMDLSLREVTTKLGTLLENNSEKFQAAQSKKDADAKELAETQEKAQQLEEETAQLNDQVDSLEEKIETTKKKQSRIQSQIDNHNDIQEELRKQLGVKQTGAGEAGGAEDKAAKEAEQAGVETQGNDELGRLFSDPEVKAAGNKVLANGSVGRSIFSSLSTIADIDINGSGGYDRSLFVKSLTGRIETLAKQGNQQAVNDALALIKAYNNVANKPAVTSRNGVWKLGTANEPVPKSWASMNANAKRTMVELNAFGGDFDGVVNDLVEQHGAAIKAAGVSDVKKLVTGYANDYINDAIATLDAEQMELSELSVDDTKSTLASNIENDYPELSEDDVNRQLKQILLDVIGRKNIAANWTIDKGEDNEPRVYFYAPDRDADTVFGEYMVYAKEDATLNVAYSEGSPIDGGDGLTTWDEVKAVILADYEKEKAERDAATEEQDQGEQPDTNDDGTANLFWYGLRARPYGIGTTPADHQVVQFLDTEQAKEKFPDAGNSIRHGAIGYDKQLPADQVSAFELAPLFGTGAGDEKLAYKIVDTALSDWLDSKDLDELTQDQLNTLKMGNFKSIFGNVLREQVEYQERKINPTAYKNWNASIDLVTPELIQKVAEDEYHLAEEQGPDANEQQQKTQARMKFIDSATDRLKNIETLPPKERKRAVMLASRSLGGITKSPKRGEGVAGQAARIASQMRIVEELQGETYASLDAQFKNRQQIVAFLKAKNIPYRKLNATRESLLKSILAYRDNFFASLNNMFEMAHTRKDVYDKFENGEAISIEDVEKGFGGTSVYRLGDYQLAKIKGEAVVPAMDEQGEDYRTVERYINDIADGEYPNFKDVSDEDLFAQYFRYAGVTMTDILSTEGSRYLRNDPNLTEQEATAIQNGSMPTWYVAAVEAEAQMRGLPDLHSLTSYSHKGELARASEKRYDYAVSIGKQDGVVIDLFTGRIVERNLDGKEAVAKANELNSEHQKAIVTDLFKMLKDGETLEELADRKVSRSYPPVNQSMFTTVNGLECIYNSLAAKKGTIHGGLQLKDNALEHIAIVKAGGEFDFDSMTEDQNAKLDELGITTQTVITPKGEKLTAVSIKNSRVLLTKAGGEELAKLLGTISAAKADDVDEATKDKTEEEKQLLALDSSEFNSGSIYDAENIGDVKTIASRVRSFLTQMKKAGRLPKDVVISVKKDSYNSLALRLVGLPENVMLWNPEYLQFEIDNPNSTNSRGISFYTEEVNKLIEFVNAYVDQYNYNNSDSMTDYFDVNFYGGRLEVDFDFKRERKVIELESLTETHQQGDQVESKSLDMDYINNTMNDGERAQLEELERFTGFKMALGKQEVTFPAGKVKQVNITDEDDALDKLESLYETLTSQLNEKSALEIKPLENWQSLHAYASPEVNKLTFITSGSIKTNHSNDVANAYGDKYLIARHGSKAVYVYPVIENGQYSLAAYFGGEQVGTFESANELEMLCIHALDLTQELPAPENTEEMEHVEKLKTIRDYKGEVTLELLEQYQDDLEKAYEHFEANGTYPENEPLMEAAFANYAELQSKI
ncbi:hypothetical protein [Vibrio parahaemolyticus]|uniref:defense against restriction DarA-related protein n=1 Tax=Vibrio parahaemolyticus TaxID=670 RepID=UPI003D814B57